jgi:hypothetical protein
MTLIRRVQTPGRRTTETRIRRGDWSRSFHPEGGRYWTCATSSADLDRILSSTDTLKRIPGEKSRHHALLGGLYLFPPDEAGSGPVFDVAEGRAADTNSRPVILAARSVHAGLQMAFDEDVVEWLYSDLKEHEAGKVPTNADFIAQLQAAPRLRARLLDIDRWGQETPASRRVLRKLTLDLWNFGGGFEKLGRTFRCRILSPVKVVIIDAETDTEGAHGGLVILYCNIEPGTAAGNRLKLATVDWD